MSIYENLELLPHNLDGWHGNSPIFRKLIEEVNPNHIIEVGAWYGQSTINMAKILKEDKRDCKITTVDTWLGALEFIDKNKKGRAGNHNLLMKNGYPQAYYQFLSNVVHNKVEDYIEPFPNTSLIGARYFAKNNIKADLIYIDASHDYEDVLLDLKAYKPLLNDGGIIFGDDYVKGWPGVIEAVDKVFPSAQIVDNNFWVVRD
jgi:predicted O-methyltransferase YrrM